MCHDVIPLCCSKYMRCFGIITDKSGTLNSSRVLEIGFFGPESLSPILVSKCEVAIWMRERVTGHLRLQPEVSLALIGMLASSAIVTFFGGKTRGSKYDSTWPLDA